MPRNWLNYTEDRDPIWVADVLAGMAAFYGSLLFLEEMGKFAGKLADLEKARRRRGS